MKKRYKFKAYVYEGAYAPYYDAYKDQVFTVDHHMVEDTSKQHVWLICVSNPDIIIGGYVHYHDLDQIEGEQQ